MTQPVALITNALVYAGPPAVDALFAAGFQVVVHDLAFASADARANYRDEHQGVIVLPDQDAAAIVRSAVGVIGRLDPSATWRRWRALSSQAR
jgi:hypothetical protein